MMSDQNEVGFWKGNAEEVVIIQGKNRPLIRSAAPNRPMTWTRRRMERDAIERSPFRQAWPPIKSVEHRSATVMGQMTSCTAVLGL
jgi:hypothetical protein